VAACFPVQALVFAALSSGLVRCQYMGLTGFQWLACCGDLFFILCEIIVDNLSGLGNLSPAAHAPTLTI
jgi:hypothetical protein